MTFRTCFRDKQEWLSSTNNTIDLRTSSDEAAKAYDAIITQVIGWYEDDTLNGIQGMLDRMLKADPEFLLGQALALELNLLGGLNAPRLDKKLADKLSYFNNLVDKKQNGQASEHELLHAQVVNCWAKNDLENAARVLEKLTTLYPEDIAAIKLSQDTYFYLGQSMPMRNTIANCLSKINTAKNPLAGYAHGMFAFALEESNMYPQSKQHALKALELNPHDTWAIHNYAHCLEMQGQTDDGLSWMLSKRNDWAPCSLLASHQYWHTALFHINNNHFGEAVALLDKEVLPRCARSGSAMELHDACSMVYRMELIDLFANAPQESDGDKQRWSILYDQCKPHKRDHLIGFNDAHFMMSFLGQGDLDTARELIESINDVPEYRHGQTVVKPLLEAMLQYKLGNYSKCADLLEPIRFDIVRIGGSHAQRDVFEQLLLVAALKSDKSYHKQLAQRMLSEREMFHGRQTMQTKLLAAQAA